MPVWLQMWEGLPRQPSGLRLGGLPPTRALRSSRLLGQRDRFNRTAPSYRYLYVCISDEIRKVRCMVQAPGLKRCPRRRRRSIGEAIRISSPGFHSDRRNDWLANQFIPFPDRHLGRGDSRYRCIYGSGTVDKMSQVRTLVLVFGVAAAVLFAATA